jgi:hypothetical protein
MFMQLPAFSADSVVEVMIVAITNTKLRVMVGAHSVSSKLSIGNPQLDCLMVMPGMAGMSRTTVTHTYEFKPLTANKLYVTITPFAETDPNLVVSAPASSTSGAPRSWYVLCALHTLLF